MQFELPRRQRKSFESITKSSLSEKFNKEQSIDAFNKVKNEYEKARKLHAGKIGPPSYSNDGTKEEYLELLIIISDQIASEYKDFEVSFKQGVPEISKIKSS